MNQYIFVNINRYHCLKCHRSPFIICYIFIAEVSDARGTDLCICPEGHSEDACDGYSERRDSQNIGKYTLYQ